MSAPPEEIMCRVDETLAHVWMVRAFLKHSEEAEEDEELAGVHRDLYDYMLALGPSFQAGDSSRYLQLARKKLGKLKKAAEKFVAIQPEISTHTNFEMAVRSLTAAVGSIERLLSEAA